MSTGWIGGWGILVLGILSGCGGKADSDEQTGPGLLDSAEAAVDLTGCREWLASGQASTVETGCSVGTDDWRALFLAAGGAIFPVGADRYYGVWLPEGWQPGQPLIYAVHNTDGCAEQIFNLWTRAGPGYGMVLLQYRSAGGSDFDNEETIYANLKAAHAETAAHCPIDPSPRAYYGFSRGAARGYGVSVLDTAAEQQLLDAYIIDSGILPGGSIGAGTEAMAGARYWMWCGAEDVDPTNAARPMCETMREDMVGSIERLGGRVDSLIEEPGACHGMFFFDCDDACGNCRRREASSLGESLPLLFAYIDTL